MENNIEKQDNAEKRDVLPVERWESLLKKRWRLAIFREGFTEWSKREKEAHDAVCKFERAHNLSWHELLHIDDDSKREKFDEIYNVYHKAINNYTDNEYGLKESRTIFDHACGEAVEMVNDAEGQDALTPAALEVLLGMKGSVVMAAGDIKRREEDLFFVRKRRWKGARDLMESEKAKDEAVQERKRREDVFHEACAQVRNGEMKRIEENGRLMEEERSPLSRHENWEWAGGLLAPYYEDPATVSLRGPEEANEGTCRVHYYSEEEGRYRRE